MSGDQHGGDMDSDVKGETTKRLWCVEGPLEGVVCESAEQAYTEACLMFASVIRGLDWDETLRVEVYFAKDEYAEQYYAEKAIRAKQREQQL